MFTKGSTTPIKTVHFNYVGDADVVDTNTPELCQGIKNGTGGKLTLESVYFTYKNNNRGRLNPYVFKYNGSNPNYSEFAYDRWGTYRNSGNCDHVYNPYTQQYDTNQDIEQQHRDDVMAWHLSEIQMPSGSVIKLSLGRDHYGYVQDRVATQMFNIVGLENGLGDNTLYKGTHVTNEDNMKVYFELEKATNNQAELDRYFNDLYRYTNDNGNEVYQMYYKVNANLTNHNEDKQKQDVEGYADILDYGFDTSSQSGNLYTRAFIVLDHFPIANRGDFYHPMTIGNWQFLKTHIPEQMYGDMGDAPEGDDQIAQKVGSFFSVYRNIRGIFSSYYRYCKVKDYGLNVKLDRSYIKLNSPDRKKFGGGVRVEKVEMYDDYWEAETGETVPTYGTIYEYETEEMVYNPSNQLMEATGYTISSGVASNEPAVGAEESALKYAKNYTQSIKGSKDNYFFFEYPINESLYPGPAIGYSKVKVKSLASDLLIKKSDTNYQAPTSGYGADNDDIDGFAASGLTVHEYYTAKDFPVVTDETEINNRPKHLWIPIPFVGQMTFDYYTASQGYSVETNDMHGRPKKTTSYGLTEGGEVIKDPISWSEYQYQIKKEEYTLGGKKRQRMRLDNFVDVLIHDDMNQTNATTQLGVEMGVDRQLFSDIRDSRNTSVSGGLDYNGNLELLGFIPLAFACPWPSFSMSDSELRTSVSNKIIRKSGILKKAIAFDGQSTVETENRLYDPMTGQAVLTTVNNLYDDPIYNYNIPARFAYESMGAAYENLDFAFEANINHNTCNNTIVYTKLIPTISNNAELLIEGDEYIVSQSGNILTKATLISKEGDLKIVLDDDSIPDGIYELKVIRSGKRNHLGASVGSITALSDPLTNRTKVENCQYNITVYDTQQEDVCHINPSFVAFVDLVNLINSTDIINESGTLQSDGLKDWNNIKYTPVLSESIQDGGKDISSIPIYDYYLDIINQDSNNSTPFTHVAMEIDKNGTEYTPLNVILYGVDNEGTITCQISLPLL